MGTDIFASIEYISSDTTFDKNDDWLINNLTDFSIGNVYDFFGLIGGVNSISYDPLSTGKCKGLPKTISVNVKRKILLKYSKGFLCKKCTKAGLHKVDFDGFTIVNKQELKSLYNITKVTFYDKQESLILNPTFHSYTWLSLLELKAAYSRYMSQALKENPIEFYPIATLDAIIASMDILESRNYTTRIIFWFT
jgi:hypothetical protein